MASDPVGQRPGRVLLTLGPLDRIRVQVGHRAVPDGPAHQQFLLDLPLPEAEDAGDPGRLDEAALLAALEPVLYVGSDAPRHYSLHQHRWHTSWGPSPGTLELGILVTTGSRGAALTEASLEGVRRAFRALLELAGPPVPTPTSRDAAVTRARGTVATAYAVDPGALSLSTEAHDLAENSWTLGLRNRDGDEFHVVVGFVDGYAGSVRVRHGKLIEVFDSVGSE